MHSVGRPHLANRPPPSQQRLRAAARAEAASAISLGKRRPAPLLAGIPTTRSLASQPAASIDEFGRPIEESENCTSQIDVVKRSRHTLSPAKHSSPETKAKHPMLGPQAKHPSSTLPNRRKTTTASISAGQSRIPRHRASMDSLAKTAATTAPTQAAPSIATPAGSNDDDQVFGLPAVRSRTFSFTQPLPAQQQPNPSTSSPPNNKTPFVPSARSRAPPDSLRSRQSVVRGRSSAGSATSGVPSTPSAVKLKAAAWEQHVATPSMKPSRASQNLPPKSSIVRSTPSNGQATARYPRPSSSLAQRLASESNALASRPLPHGLETPLAKERGMRRLSGQMAFPGTGRWMNGGSRGLLTRMSSGTSLSSLMGWDAEKHEREREEEQQEERKQEGKEEQQFSKAQGPSTPLSPAEHVVEEAFMTPQAGPISPAPVATRSDEAQGEASPLLATNDIVAVREKEEERHRLEKELHKAHEANKKLSFAHDEMASKLQGALEAQRRSASEHQCHFEEAERKAARSRAEVARMKSIIRQTFIGEVVANHSHLATSVKKEVNIIGQQDELCRLLLSQLDMYEAALTTSGRAAEAS